MKITNTSIAFTGPNTLLIDTTTRVNKARPYLYNEVRRITSENPVTTHFRTNDIKIDAPNDSTNIGNIIIELKKLGIQFIKGDKIKKA